MSTLSTAIREASQSDLADMTAFIVSECEMCTQDADGNMIDLVQSDVIAAFRAWSDMHRTVGTWGETK
ncbi:MAG: hypothetical protein AAFQ19_07470 [Pseudomonadota bacterium]